jgi:rod shape-determining protein MreC
MFFVRNYFVLLFISLEVIALTLFVSNTYYQRSIVVNATNGFTGFFYNLRTSITQYLSLKGANDQLAEQNAGLMNRDKKSYIITNTNSIIIDDTLYRKQYEYIAVKVINNTTNHKMNYLTLNKGRSFNIQKNMAVISPKGVVGLVTDVSENFSLVRSVLNIETNVSAILKKNNYDGTVTWNGRSTNIAVMSGIPSHVQIAAGDTVITSGYSLFPEGIMIGTISGYKPGKLGTYLIDVKLSTDFNNIRYVYVVRNLMKDELEKLESGAQKE